MSGNDSLTDSIMIFTEFYRSYRMPSLHRFGFCMAILALTVCPIQGKFIVPIRKRVLEMSCFFNGIKS